MDPATPSTPARSTDQRRQALNIANRVRSERARLKRDIRAGRAAVIPVLLDPPDCVQNAKVLEVLLAAPKYGQVRVGRTLARVGVSPSKTIAGLTGRQRAALIDAIERSGLQVR